MRGKPIFWRMLILGIRIEHLFEQKFREAENGCGAKTLLLANIQ
jgi:hypothetical protein